MVRYVGSHPDVEESLFLCKKVKRVSVGYPITAGTELVRFLCYVRKDESVEESQ